MTSSTIVGALAALTVAALLVAVVTTPDTSEFRDDSPADLVGRQYDAWDRASEVKAAAVDGAGGEVRRGVENARARFAVVSLYADEQRALIPASLENKRHYCRRQGCALYVPVSLASSARARRHRTAHYTKILAVQLALQMEALEHEWVVWTDADAVFFNTSISPTDALQWALQNAVAGAGTTQGPVPGVPFPASAGRVASVDDVDLVLTWPLNTGCFFVRNTPTARALLTEWFEYDLAGPRKVERRWNDQGALIDILATSPPARKRVAYVNYETHPLAAEWPWYGTHSWQVHMPGRPLDKKVALLRRIDDERRDVEDYFLQQRRQHN
jgi:hypothetical protein